MNAALRILIVDDHPLVREGLRACIDAECDMQVDWEADSIDAAIKVITSETPDLALVDLSLGDGNGFGLIKRIRLQGAKTRILVISAHDEALYAEKALQLGASGYLEKLSTSEQIIAAMRQVVAGERYLSPKMTQRMIDLALASGSAPGHAALPSLSDREREVFELIGNGLATREIAERLHISPKTVESHQEKIKKKLALDSGSELQRRAIQWVLEDG